MKHYYFIGIGGVSMLGIAQFLLLQGNKVSGSDLKGCEELKDRCKIFDKHDAKNITNDIDIVVRTSAITPSSAGYVEVEAATKMKIPVLKRSELIGKMLHNVVSIGVTGMHGKSTTSSMIATILHEAKLKPSFLIGANVLNFGKSWNVGESVIPPFDEKKAKPKYLPDNTVFNKKVRYFVVEACEYDRSFLDIKPKIGVITNIDKEHLDYYKGGLPEIKKAFKKFIKNLSEDGLLIVNQDDHNVMSLIKYAKCKVKRVSINKPWPGLKLQIPGRHNLLDATLAAKVAHELGIENKTIKKALNNFIGAGRRFEIRGESDSAIVIDDYGHHPTEIRATIQAAKEKYPNKKIIMVFQPHQYARTKILFNDFVKSFDGVDELIIADTYIIAGREKDIEENLSQKLAQTIKENGINAIYISGYDEICNYLQKNIKKDSIIITQGATNIFKVGDKYLNK